MPYIITTRRTAAYAGSDGKLASASRRAVTTIEEARAATNDAIYRVSGEYEDERFAQTEAFYPQAAALPESGGTIGPLPDGTVIEVRECDWLELTTEIARDNAYGGNLRVQREIVDAYNVKQRLEELRGALRAENISWGELHELQGLAEHIEPGDVELLEAAGVPEFPEES